MKWFNKRIIHITLWSFSGIMLVVLLGFSDHKQQEQICKGLKIKISDNTGNYFIEPKDIVDLLNNKAGRVKKSAMKDIDLILMEKIVYTNPFIQKAEVYSTIDGYVNIEVWQRNPIIRVINVDNEHFYIDENGEFMPVTDKYTCHVPVASGYIYDRQIQQKINPAPLKKKGFGFSKPILVQINEIAQYLKQNEFWDAQIEQVYVNESSEIELVPRVGNHTILIGNSENLDIKMNNLFIFYKEGLVKKGWDKYSVINLKYKDQVICTKSTNQSNS